MMDEFRKLLDLTYASQALNSTIHGDVTVSMLIYDNTEKALQKLIVALIVMGLLLTLLLYLIRGSYRWVNNLLYGIYYYEPDLEYLRGPGGNKLAGVKRSVKPSENNGHRKGVPVALPNGWYFVCIASNLKNGEVREFKMAGFDLAVFRDEFGHVHGLDAYCPHVGANMAMGGTVRGSCLECPFHAWRFEGSDGKCTHIPGANKVPDVAKVHSWAVLERNKIIWVWFDAENRDPLWMPSELTEVYEEGYEPYAQGTHYIRAHISELPENGADVAHFDPVHKYNFLYGRRLENVRSLKTSYLDCNWNQPYWEPAEEWYVAQGGVRHDMGPFGWSFPPLVVRTTYRQYGPGIVHLKPVLFGGIKLMIVQTVTPVSTFHQRVVHVTFGPKGFIGKLRSILALYGEGVMFERDCTLWHNKMYNQQGIMAATPSDELLVKFRRWFNQFYSESSKERTCEKDLSW